jgi:hypothetical protein
VLCVLAFVALWIAQMITGLVPCVNHCELVLFIRGTTRSFVWVSTLCLVLCLFGLRPRAFARHAIIWVSRPDHREPSGFSMVL